ncbi:hypothetical protein D3C84_450560 [compost metagenome]
MANLKRYTLVDSWKDWGITLEVDHDLLTSELATLINEFWSGHEYRLEQAGGDVVWAVVRMAAERFVYALLEVGGGLVSSSHQAEIWTEKLHDQEGWGGTAKGSAFGRCGIRLVEADVEVVLDLEFKEA